MHLHLIHRARRRMRLERKNIDMRAGASKATDTCLYDR